MEYDAIMPAVSGLDKRGLEVNSLAGLEQFFHEAYTVENTARLMSAMVVHKIVTQELFRPEYDNLYSYLKAAPDRLNISHQTAASLYYSADFFLRHHAALNAQGFRIMGDFSKLRHAHLACNHHTVAEVVTALCTMTFREFLAYTFPASPALPDYSEVRIDGDKIVSGKKTLFTVEAVRKIVSAGEIPALMGFASATEKRAVENYLKARRSGK